MTFLRFRSLMLSAVLVLSCGDEDDTHGEPLCNFVCTIEECLDGGCGPSEEVYDCGNPRQPRVVANRCDELAPPDAGP